MQLTLADQNKHLTQAITSPHGLTWMLGVMLLALLSYWQYSEHMDVFEVAILFASAVALAGLGLMWRSVQFLFVMVFILTLVGLASYASAGNLIAAAEQKFLLKYLLSSQSAIMWMNTLFVLATFTYFFALWKHADFTGKVASGLTWSAVTFGLTGLAMRWRESYLINPDYGHIPVSNLYEVFILFAILTAILYLYYEQRMRTRALGGFVLLIISAAVIFILWYTFGRGAHEIQPLVPALKSYWMKIHVPANFIGYGTFAMTAMIAIAYLWRYKIEASGDKHNPWLLRLPSLTVMEDIMYRGIALGFAFFTIATILGAMWAAEAWGGYWSWDPKETWALIVWLNYAAWLHLRLSKGWRGPVMAWWALIGLLVTTFAFLGVNMFLSGLHSYGSL